MIFHETTHKWVDDANDRLGCLPALALLALLLLSGERVNDLTRRLEDEQRFVEALAIEVEMQMNKLEN
jgi:hypothetical protein